MIKITPKNPEEKYTIDELYGLIEMLRSPEGCPWDREQTHETLIKPMIEEAFEAVDAINSKSNNKLIEELGDVLLQVIFHSIIGKENNEFEFDDITDRCARKMLFRHTHVFGDAVAENSGEALLNWEQRKLVEKSITSLYQDLSELPKNLPALMRATKMAKKIRKAGYIQETDIKLGNADAVGEMLYNICAAAEQSGVDPYLALQKTLDSKIEKYKNESGRKVSDETGQVLKSFESNKEENRS